MASSKLSALPALRRQHLLVELYEPVSLEAPYEARLMSVVLD
jgi:hypothetical protein